MSSKDKQINWQNRSVLQVGLGLHGGGVGTARWLCRQGAKLTITDRKNAVQLADSLKKLKGLKIKYKLGGHWAADFKAAVIIVANPGVDNHMPLMKQALRAGKLIVNEATMFIENCPARSIGITGTRGKTTTSLLLHEILRRQNTRTFVSGNVRLVPMLDYLDRLKKSDLVVLELSSFQLELLPRIKKSPNIAIVTNIFPDHLNRYRSMAEYIDAKKNLIRFQTKKDAAILNADDPIIRSMAKETKAAVHWFGRSLRPLRPFTTVHQDWVVEYQTSKPVKILPLKKLKLAGDHQVMNLLAAVTAARVLKVPITKVANAVSQFRGVPYRQQFIRRWRGHDFINDTTATSPDGVIAAMNVWPHGLFLVGGTDKQLPYRPLVEHIKNHKISVVLLPGSATAKIIKEIDRQRIKPSIPATGSLKLAVQLAIKRADPGQPIILCPGAASFEHFKHEFDRGEQFNRLVKQLP